MTGYTYDRDDGVVNGVYIHRPKNARWQRDLLAYLTSGSAVIPHRKSTGLSAATRAALHRGGLIAKANQWHVWAVDRSTAATSSSAG